MRLYEVFGSDTLLSYLVDHLQSPTCTITKVSDGFYLGSSYIDVLLVVTGNIGLGAGLLSVLKQIDPNFDKKKRDEKVKICIDGILYILNGIINAKYNHWGLQIIQSNSSDTTKIGKIINSINGNKTFTVTKTIQTRIIVQARYEEFEEADKQPYTGMEIWNIARNDEHVARALYYYAKAGNEDRYNLNKVREEIEGDVGYGTLVKWIGEFKIEAFQEWANDPSISGGESRHSKGGYIKFIREYFMKNKRNYKNKIAPGSPCPIDFCELLLKWISTK
ncbi:MAG TPA: hypothetical protein VEP90_15355 [Methylomirabilota bacterium]|nr:hypothetical protein [Methylomirabilota bacterium]